MTSAAGGSRATRAGVGDDASERILRAALQAFSENGFDGAKTRDIAARAGVTLGLLQYYYGGKLELWKAAVALAFTELDADLSAIVAGADAADDRERMRRVIRAFVGFVAKKPEFVRMMHEEGKRRGPRMRWLVDHHVKPVYEGFSPLIERAQEQGLLLAGVPPVHFVYILLGAITVIFHQAEECKRISGIDPTSEGAVEAHARAVEAFLLGPPNQETAP